MSDTSTAKVRQKAIELLSVAPEGIRYMDLHRAIAESYPDIPINTVHGAFHKFRNNLPADIQLVAKGLYRHVKFTQAQEAAAVGQRQLSPRMKRMLGLPAGAGLSAA